MIDNTIYTSLVFIAIGLIVPGLFRDAERVPDWFKVVILVPALISVFVFVIAVIAKIWVKP